MAELLQRIRTQITNFVQNLDKRMRMWLAVGGLFVVLVVIAILFLTRAEYVPLGTDFELADMAAITTKLDENNISNRAEGTSIMVDVDDLTKAKMLIAVELNINQPDYSWTDVFANTSFNMTSEVREQQMMVAKASALGQGIENIEGVDQAIVELYIAPESSFLLDNKKESSVSIILILENGFVFSQQQVEGLVNLVMNSVKNLPKENITIVDQTGTKLNRLSENTDAFIASDNYEQTMIVQNQLEDKLNNFLGTMFGRSHVKVATSVTLDFDDFESQSTAFTPPVDGASEGMIRSMSEITELVKNSDTASGVPGTDTNTEVTDYPQGGDGTTAIESASKTVNYEMNEIVQVLRKAKGTIKDITVSVLIDTTKLPNNALSEEMKQDIISVVTSAAGLETRSVKVIAAEFVEDELGLIYSSEDANVGPGIPLWLVGAILGVLLVGVIIFFVMSRSKANKQKQEEIAAIQAAEEEKRKNELDEIQMDIEDKSSPKYQIEKFIDAKPEAVAALLRSWMSDM
jgi:flagellar M-ring protein FliF